VEYYQLTLKDLLEKLGTSREDGLSYASARKKLEKNGPNKILLETKPLWKKVLEPFANVFIAILLAAVVFSFLAGEYLDGIIVTGIIIINAVIYYIQQYSTERVLRALKKHNEQVISVKRQGRVVEVQAHELVVGDILVLGEGQKIPADSIILSSENLAVDESILTGETMPVHKNAGHITTETAVYKRTNTLFSGTFITNGLTESIVVATGNNTEFGRLADLVKPEGKTPIQKKIDQIVSVIIKAVAVTSLLVFILSLLRGVAPDEALRFMLTLTVSSVPEDLPIALTAILVIAMRKMAKKKALARSMHAIENLGLVNVIATDKTGTLTKNLLEVHDYWAPASVSEPMLKMYVALASNVHESKKQSDPLDYAMGEFSQNAKKPKEFKLARQFSFVQKMRMSGVLWKSGSKYELYVKGSPEHLLNVCGLRGKQLHEAQSNLHKLASKGYRVIGIASTKTRKEVKELGDLSTKLTFHGFIGVADSLRSDVKQAITDAQSAGIEVKMITGDHYETAFHIGKELGLASHPSEVFNAEEHRGKVSLPAQVVKSHTIFARILPEDKLKILKSLKRKNITAMTGDGVNDVPALTAADVGIAMGSGADIAKESGDIVLLDDSFKTIIDAIREGRVVFANIRKMLFYLFSGTLAETLTMIGALLIGLPLPVTAIQILWVNLVTDTTMVLPLGLDPAEDDVMKQPPRKADAPILDKVMITRLLLLGVTLAGVILYVFSRTSKTHSLEYAQTISFTMLVVGQWVKAQIARSEKTSVFKRMLKPNYAQMVGYTLAITLQALVLFGPLRTVFGMPEIALADLWQPIILTIVAVLFVGELHKFLTKNIKRS
jgi:Ca2+-transporting ATPase